MNRARTHYVERSPWPGFATAVFWGSFLLACYPILAGWDHDLPVRLRLPIVGGIVFLAVVIQTTFAGLTVRVEQTGLLLHLGSVPLIRRRVPYDEIVALESVAYHPIREFGGWGVRGFGRRRAWTARGNRAVKLTLTDDRELLVGSDHPQRLEERIRTVAGIVQGPAGR